MSRRLAPSVAQAMGTPVRSATIGQAHALAWAGLLMLARPLRVDAMTWTAALGLWARRFARRYVFRAGPALRIRRSEHVPAITVSVDHADQAAAIAARHHASRR